MGDGRALPGGGGYGRAKVAYTARLVTALKDGRRLHRVYGPEVIPAPGDVLLARVVSVGHHRRIERYDGRRSWLFPGDEVVVAYGARYAPDQFEAEVPDTLAECDLVAAGGLAGQVVAGHATMGTPTRLNPVGLLADDTGVLNLRRFAAVPPAAGSWPDPGVPVTVVAGTSMNAGKTTTAAALVRGLAAAGTRVGAAKVTGTGAGGDRWLLEDAGACRVLDFTDAGYPSTCHVPLRELEAIFMGLVGELAADGAQAVVVEVADGLLQAETRDLLAAASVRQVISAVVFAASDALGAVAGVGQLRALGLEVAAVSGRLTASPLATREAQAALDVPVRSVEQLSSGAVTADAVRPLQVVA